MSAIIYLDVAGATIACMFRFAQIKLGEVNVANQRPSTAKYLSIHNMNIISVEDSGFFISGFLHLGVWA